MGWRKPSHHSFWAKTTAWETHFNSQGIAVRARNIGATGGFKFVCTLQCQGLVYRPIRPAYLHNLILFNNNALHLFFDFLHEPLSCVELDLGQAVNRPKLAISVHRLLLRLSPVFGDIIMTQTSPHAPAPQACRPVNQTDCSTCMLSYDCRSTSRSSSLSWPIVAIGLIMAAGAMLRVFGVV